MGFVGALSAIGMALGPPCIYIDQAWSIIKAKDSSGFSPDVCAVLLIANITRCVFWLGSRFEIALLMQSVFLIIAMLVLLFILLRYRKETPSKANPRPFDFWQWPSYGTYIEFLAGLIVILCVSYLVLGGFGWFVDTLGFVALGIESQLPTPQAIANYKRKTTHGLRLSTLAGWLGGDVFKVIYFLLKGQPKQFVICGLVTVSIDCLVVGQRMYYGTEAPMGEEGGEGALGEEERRLTELGEAEGEGEEEEEEDTRRGISGR